MGKFAIVKGAEHRPHATILTGRSGIGKTHFASTIPGVFFICVEQGLKGASPEHVDSLQRFERPKSLGEYLEMLAEVRGMAKAAGIRHVVSDSLSGIERLINLQTCRQENVAHMESKDFKKLWTAAMPLWQRVQNELDLVRDEAGAHVWLIAHGQETKTSTVDGDMFQTWDLALQGSGDSLSQLRQLWRGWADHVLFIDWDADVTKGSIGKKAVGKYKSRILRTRETPSHYAKNRANLPPTLPATWVDLARAMSAGAPATDTKMRGQLATVLAQLGAEDRAAIEADAKAAKTATALSAVLSRAQGMVSAARLENEDDAPPPPPDGEAEPMALPDQAAAAAEVVAAADEAIAADAADETIRIALEAAKTAAEIADVVASKVVPLKLAKGSPRHTRIGAWHKSAAARVAAESAAKAKPAGAESAA